MAFIDTAGSADEASPVPRRFKRTALNFIAGFGLLLLLTAAALYVSLSLVPAFGWVNRTQQVINQAREVFRLVVDAEGGQRGYLITGDDSFLRPFDEAERKVRLEVAALGSRVSDNPRQSAAVAQISKVVDEALRQLRLKVEARRTQGFDAARASVLTARAEIQIDDLRRHVDEFVGMEEALLAQRQEGFIRRSHLGSFAIALALAVSILLLGLEVRVLYRRMRELETVLTICAWTKRVKHRGQWVSVEEFLLQRFGLRFTHGISDEAARRLELEALESAERRSPPSA